ncbi:hypothetical protein TBLA_0B05010 [Henningerozyma blattae CBS 6284]|uniref:Cytochrome b-c1 complex subunit 2, mitochondrial n=1 Tax=Henningerozyma blattae (strain ATCC 34711 / CBS 6284 / DSM 70876 / NBRC 10599 / NRRL Y-10934 / UCD 77-7) TaxID=1071380 RepID=I2GYY4_HENB6|nr:hypothetical protein TBLA_0B05010 [Tetrapisispora blattae CBS 6284]CCH59336.1 hypothetical protein TBLA_0B05010 [Tetrapisispora blattae CBS 6284]
MLRSGLRKSMLAQSARFYNVSAVDTPSAVSSLAVRVRGGSRYSDKDGVSHLLSRFNYQDTAEKSSLRLVRESELLGGKLQSTVDREYITLSAQFLKQDLPYFVEAIGNVLSKTSFNKWELTESVLPAAQRDFQVSLLDSVKTAENGLFNLTFRNSDGLGKPVLYDGIEEINVDDIKNFSQKIYTKENIEIVGRAVNEADLKKFVEESAISQLPTGTSLASSQPPKTFSGEARYRSAVLGENVCGISVPVKKEQFDEFEVLANYLKSPLSGDSIYKTVDDCQLLRFNDIGLFTLYVKGTDPAQVGTNIKAIVNQLKQGQDITKAIELTRTAVSIENASVANVNLVEKQLGDLSKIKEFKLNEFSYVAVGNVSKLPFKDEL